MGTSIDCITDDILAQLLDGELPPARRSEVLGHVAECAGCRILLVELLKEADPEVRPEGPEDGGGDVGARDSWAPPQEFGGLRVERRLGKGAMGVVYLAWDKSLQRRVALKFIASEDPGWCAQLKVEAQALARLHHPNVVAVHSFGQVEGHPFIVAEYVEGQNLARIKERLPWRRVLGIALGLARGLRAVHEQGLLHRDIKAENVVLPGDGEVKLLDFGLAAPLNHPVNVAGTPYYMAPELFMNAPASPQSDLFALGIVLAELLRGKVPHERWAGSPDEALAGLEEGIDPDFVALIARCLEPDPARRPASAEALAEALQRLHDAQPGPADLLSGNPYRGLAPFEAEHSALFRGRNDDIRAVVERTERQPMVIIAGDSGVGKSSLCRAGVLPGRAARAKEAGRRLECLTVVPGQRPLRSLAVAIAPMLRRGVEAMTRALEESPEAVARDLRVVGGGDRGELLLFVDQVEELVTLAQPDDGDCFARFLGELALPTPNVRVLLAVRGDYLTRISALPGLGDQVQGAFHLLRHMSPAGLREAIVGPARSRGVVFESQELIDTLVASAAGPGSLPLLQFALAELWDHRDWAANRITRTKLDEMGGVAGALSRHADEVLKGLTPKQVDAARQVFLHLVTRERTRIERSEEELASNPRKREVIPALVNGRLLHARAEAGRTMYQLAHDSLIGGWATLRSWLDVDTTLLPIRQRLKAASEEWVRLKHARDALAGWRLLDDADRLDTDALSRRERLFLDKSRLAARRRRLILLTAPIGAALVVALIIVLTVLTVSRQDKLRREAQAARSAEEQLARVLPLLRQAGGLGQAAVDMAEEAHACSDGKPPAGKTPADLGQTAEDLWKEAQYQLKQAHETWAEADDLLKPLSLSNPDNAKVRDALGNLLADRIYFSEALLHQPQMVDRVRLVELEKHGLQRDGRLAPTRLDLDTDLPGARVTLSRLDRADRAHEQLPILGPFPIPLSNHEIETGAHLLQITGQDGSVINLPLLLVGGRHEKLHVPSSVPEGFVYIPAGCSLEGSDPRTGWTRTPSPPLHRVCLDHAYLIGRTEVTFGDWLEYLESTRETPEGKDARGLLWRPRPGFAGAAVSLRWRNKKMGWEFTFQPGGKAQPLKWSGGNLVHPARETDSTVRWKKFPLVGVSSQALTKYIQWLDRSRKLPGARFCTEREWEKGARGADDRAFPHGDRLVPGEANIHVDRGPSPAAMALDEVDAHPESASPYGLLGMAGNASELVVTLDGAIASRGGDYAHSRHSALIEARQTVPSPRFRDATVGVRICAAYPLASSPFTTRYGAASR